jgi:hypothetical protein
VSQLGLRHLVGVWPCALAPAFNCQPASHRPHVGRNLRRTGSPGGVYRVRRGACRKWDTVPRSTHASPSTAVRMHLRSISTGASLRTHRMPPAEGLPPPRDDLRGAENDCAHGGVGGCELAQRIEAVRVDQHQGRAATCRRGARAPHARHRFPGPTRRPPGSRGSRPGDLRDPPGTTGADRPQQCGGDWPCRRFSGPRRRATSRFRGRERTSATCRNDPTAARVS